MTAKHQRIGYKRVSTVDQKTDRQLADVEVDKVFTDKASGKSTDGRPELARAVDYVREGDTLVVHSMDRLARNIVDLHQIVDALTKGGDLVIDGKTIECGGGVAVEFVKEARTFTGDDGSEAALMLGILGSVAQFERAIIKERQREGIAIAKAAGKYKGGQPKLTDEQAGELARRKAAGESMAALAREYGVSRQTAYRYAALGKP
ncbi:Site-specific DNA recombinase [Gordonia malaquae]|uniref:Putative resolvase n=1 Tax=Gordonia malaquae NBRC 108250 TaxID=1223542 RepID=M3UYD1_GORML|nr:recombinase family protein [Gordonia malaquae]GAC80832.1 putative resolvase [Gordonia malaquae NBRC 108250]SEB67946.1 Site-specific DNA recombinase [Gordonia malaquae]